MTDWKGRLLSIRHVFLLCLSVFVILFLDHPVLAQSTGTLRIYLARHGETDWNAELRLQGRNRYPLNSTGRQQAAKLAERLKGVRLDAVYSSTLSRSRETADNRSRWGATEELGWIKRAENHGKFEGKKVDGQ